MTTCYPEPLRYHPLTKAHYDVFNGDADGLCALHQLRLVMPKEAVLVTGVKRDIALLKRILQAQPGDSVTVLDISLDVNREPLVALLARGVNVEYFDHHFAGGIPRLSRLKATIDPSPDVCTAMLVDRQLEGRHRIWAVVGAFGDNLTHAARKLAEPLRLNDALLDHLRELGMALSYNAYGDTDADLIVHPAALYRMLARYSDPFDFMRCEPVFERIRACRHGDLEMARLEQPQLAFPGATVYVLPDEPWSRRVRGSFADDLASRYPDTAHAVLTPDARHGFTVSVRTPLARRFGADALCRKFATGGGRAAAAGINHLPAEQLPAFMRELDKAFAETSAASV
jgi:hypothetical protein